VVVAYGLILPQSVLDIPSEGCLNVHASLLPRWRGAAPIQRSILAGDRETGVTIMVMEAGLDTGPMLSHSVVPITDQTTGQTLHDQLSALGAKLLCDTLRQPLVAVIQPQEGVTYAQKLDKQESFIDFQEPACDIERKVRAFTPWPGTAFMWQGNIIKLLQVEVVPYAHNEEPGTIMDEQFTIACAQDAIRPVILQLPGKKPVDRDAYARGHAIPVGKVIRP
jgi:methionyl-tRNA formyltransferase